MSVIKSKRNLSKYEYVHTFNKLFKMTVNRLSKVPKRKQPYICDPIMKEMYKAYNLIMQVYNDSFIKGIEVKNEQEQAKRMILYLCNLQKPLLVLWDIEKYETKKMVNWCNLIEEEIGYIAKLNNIELRGKYMFIIDYKAKCDAKFLNNMSKLHRMIYTKITSLPLIVRNTNGTLLMELADEAFYRVCHANRFVPLNEKMYQNRRNDLFKALSCLRQMEQPMMSLFNIMNYSENTMTEMASMLNTETKLIKGLIKSDESRFADLFNK